MSIVETYNEWDPLEELIVGSARYAKIPMGEDKSLKAIEAAGSDFFQDIPSGNFPRKIIEETEEDIRVFIHELEKIKIKVRRPTPINHEGEIVTPYWRAGYYFSYSSRDIMLVIGNTIIETPCIFRSRYFEHFDYKELLLEYLKEGAKWIAAPKPCLKDESYNYPPAKNQGSAINNDEPMFDAANIIRAGRDIFYLVSDSGNELGFIWLKSILEPEYRVHPCYNLYSSVHIDSTVAFLRPGLMLLNPERVNEKNIPPLFKKWKIIFSPKMREVTYSDFPSISSKWLGMNLLMINPSLAVVDQNQTELIQLLERNKIDVLPMLLRHGRTLGGGFHCITLDIRRKGKLEEYF